MDRVMYRKSRDKYETVLDTGKTFSYAVSKFGKYAEKMANLSLVTKEKVNNYYEEKDDHFVLYTYNKKHNKYLEILVDKEDFNLIKDYYWGAKEDKYRFYAETFIGKSKRLYMHRLIMNPDERKMVDHINGNGLDNRRKQNLRIVDNSTNQKNLNNPTRNKLGLNGVHDNGNSYIAMWTVDGQRKRKSFSKNKYGEEEALRLAIEARKLHATKENGYLE